MFGRHDADILGLDPQDDVATLRDASPTRQSDADRSWRRATATGFISVLLFVAGAGMAAWALTAFSGGG